MRTVYYDFQILSFQKYGGISRYFYEIYNYINKNNYDWTAVTDCYFSVNEYFKPLFLHKPFRRQFKGSYFLENKFNINKRNAKRIINNGVDIVHPTYFDPYVLDYISEEKLVITVYDMIYEIYPDYFTDSKCIIENKKKLIYAADKIIAISDSTKRDIIRFYPDIPEDKIDVIYIGNSLKRDTDRANSKSINIPDKYVLFVGQRGMYKNFNLFFRSMKPIFDKYDDMYLICAGGGQFSGKEIETFGKYKERIIQMDVSDDILTQLYSSATCFVFPSLYEGFGIPTLEAFSCNCPVALSNSSSMPEVGGDAALYFDPLNANDITDVVETIISNDKIRESLIIKGKEQLKKFDWNLIVPQILRCYDSLL